MKIVFLIILVINVEEFVAWDPEELEIFDLVEEINKNFYHEFRVQQNATFQDIKKAFRALSVSLHPDKNKAEDANIRFRNIVAIYEVLKDSSKRQKYDKILVEGLPNWKTALYYYRRARKMSLMEGSLILFLIITIGQYLYAWASYLEKKLTVKQIIESKMKKVSKRKRNEAADKIFEKIPLPSLFGTLPFQIPLFIWHLPGNIRNAFTLYLEIREQNLKEKEEKVLNSKLCEMQKAKIQDERLKLKELRKRKVGEKPPEKSKKELIGYSQLKQNDFNGDDSIKAVKNDKMFITGGLWTDEDIAQLITLVKKYPAGIPGRWNSIAEIMNRSVNEVTFMAAKLKENNYRVSNQIDSIMQNKEINEEKNILVLQKNWSQEQQKALEQAIQIYKNYDPIERWNKIAEYVTSKTKEECQSRYKYLVHLVKVSKVNDETINSSKQEHLKLQNFNYKEEVTDFKTKEENNDFLNFLKNDKSQSQPGGKKRNLRRQKKKLIDEYLINN